MRRFDDPDLCSARLTAPAVAAAAIAKKWLGAQYGTRIRGYLGRMGEIEIPFVDWAMVERTPFFVPNEEIVPRLEREAVPRVQERDFRRKLAAFINLAKSYDTARTTEQTVQQEQGDNP